jgi:hypothetical protein
MPLRRPLPPLVALTTTTLLGLAAPGRAADPTAPAVPTVPMVPTVIERVVAVVGRE